MLREPIPQEIYDELNNEWLGFHTASLRLDCCIGLFVVGLILSYWAMLPAGCIMGLGLIGGRIARRDVKYHRAAVEVIEEQLKRTCR